MFNRDGMRQPSAPCRPITFTRQWAEVESECQSAHGVAASCRSLSYKPFSRRVAECAESAQRLFGGLRILDSFPPYINSSAETLRSLRLCARIKKTVSAREQNSSQREKNNPVIFSTEFFLQKRLHLYIDVLNTLT